VNRCVCEREKEGVCVREREREGEKKSVCRPIVNGYMYVSFILPQVITFSMGPLVNRCVCVFVCVCVCV